MNTRTIDWLVLAILSQLMYHGGGIPVLWAISTVVCLVSFWYGLYKEWRNERD